KMDDIGLHLAHRDVPGPQRIGRFLVAAMPKLLTLLSVVGTFAILWVGGHIILVGTDELGFHALYGFVHLLEAPMAALPALGGLLGWLVNTVFSLILAAIWCAATVVVVAAITGAFNAVRSWVPLPRAGPECRRLRSASPGWPDSQR